MGTECEQIAQCRDIRAMTIRKSLNFQIQNGYCSYPVLLLRDEKSWYAHKRGHVKQKPRARRVANFLVQSPAALKAD